MRRALFLTLALPLMLGGRAAAQTCVGTPSFSSGPVQVAAAAAFADGASGFAGSFGYGAPQRFFGKAGIGRTSYDGLDASSIELAVGGGYQIPIREGSTAELCPIASLSLGFGPNDILGTGVDLSNRSIVFGGAFGAPIGGSAQVRIVPNGSVQFAHTRTTLDDGTESTSASESYLVLSMGSGFVFDSRYSISPSVSIPVGLGDVEPSFVLAAAVQLGR